MTQEQVAIKTRDGECPVNVMTPSGNGAWPAVIFYMDGFGIRQTLIDMAQRLADAGYIVLLPDLYYRAAPYDLPEPTELFKSEAGMAKVMKLFQTTDNRKAADDTEAFLAYLDLRDDVAGSFVGTTGYCMGGAMSLTAAGRFPERVVAAASFHGGALATDSELSPHLLADRMTGRIYVAGADNDDYYPPEMAERLEEALSGAGVDHRCEIYAGALHGWTMADLPMYDEAAAERHWRELLALLQATLKQ